MSTFNELGLSSNLMQGIEELGFKTPTPIQKKIIPLIFENGNDIIGLAQTGTGKTAAFGLPLIEKVNTENNSVQVLILSPTRELCMQLAKDIQRYSKHKEGLSVVPVYGGANIDTQIKALKKGAHIIAATPGRMLDLIKRKAANINNINTVVLDEADEMLNMGFREELDNILETTPDTKQTLLFSATMSKEVTGISKNYLDNPTKITIGKQNSGAENITHQYYQVKERDRYPALKRIADINPDIYGLIFCRTRQETRDVADKLKKDGYNADALHGDLTQSQRDYVMNRFRERTLQMLVATDVAARGLDVNDISHVINYNLPEELDMYTHRSGRTGRADKSGVSISIVNSREGSKIPQIEKIIGKKCEKLPVPSAEEIYKKQMLYFIDKVKNAEADESKIEPFMELVNEKLADLSKEEVIKQFISLEFNRFLDYYKNAPDLNAKAENKTSKADGRGRNKQAPGNTKRDNGKNNGDYARFFLNLGKKDGIAPKTIIEMVTDNTRDRKIKIGDIDIKDSFSFFEIEKQHTDKLLNAFNNKKFKGRKIAVELAGDKNGGEKKSDKKAQKKR